MPHMQQQQWGRVVNLSSWAWKSGGLTAGTAYSASKGALVGLTFSLARQFAGDGVRPMQAARDTRYLQPLRATV